GGKEPGRFWFCDRLTVFHEHSGKERQHGFGMTLPTGFDFLSGRKRVAQERNHQSSQCLDALINAFLDTWKLWQANTSSRIGGGRNAAETENGGSVEQQRWSIGAAGRRTIQISFNATVFGSLG